MTLYKACEAQLTAAERKEQEKYADMVQNHNDKVFLCKMLDETSQIRDDMKLAKRIQELVKVYGIPKFFGPTDRMLFKLFMAVGSLPVAANIAIPIIKWRTRKDTTAVCLDAE